MPLGDPTGGVVEDNLLVSAEHPFWKVKELFWNAVLPDGMKQLLSKKTQVLLLFECMDLLKRKLSDINSGPAKLGRVYIANFVFCMVVPYCMDKDYCMTFDCLHYATFVKEWIARGNRDSFAVGRKS